MIKKKLKKFFRKIQFNRNTYQVLSESEMLGQRLDYFLDGLMKIQKIVINYLIKLIILKKVLNTFFF